MKSVCLGETVVHLSKCMETVFRKWGLTPNPAKTETVTFHLVN
ncbi:hypothetical protein Bhyg_14957 [Pseudolycoriella hygida]|uniref:Uncharacterized protein n=1 Tax=Pseudolycoriella hygida TaxID=35572 RepID=A0A9Q0RXY2_9DIPT|nr:hypothetical protein Bhyg_14957 [Pseudolycoriella hygida]